MKWRKVTGEERDQLLASKKPSGFDYQPYLEVIDSASDGEVVAVEIDARYERGEKIRFSRAARLRGKSLSWLAPSEEDEVVFQLGPAKAPRSRARRATQ
ncbi:MAG TPA: hypothetical protein PK593_07110 [Thermomicrobiales bacterium]|mgnify:CR=1 FL=1|jgi:hypothetical protein|nr:hypothetical protein [Chloroflexota bacterium]HBY46551.1 hypothetical protein [Chloroflexota bacterium]HQX63214.1 hypothetical protein [Thermomicrobiales bacterium]HQZ90736.1 hypothetical protein [Thermomicrobiales bacterium]HRA32276.1 hypothetical protein [Thermomicrobiales bacterium]